MAPLIRPAVTVSVPVAAIASTAPPSLSAIEWTVSGVLSDIV
ncbi:MAG: hypothetical protein ACREFH_00575 [Stellaceae bacterium]